MINGAFLPSIGMIAQPVPRPARIEPAMLPSIGLMLGWVPQTPAAPSYTNVYASAQRYIDRYGFDEAVQLLMDEEHLLTSTLFADALRRAAGGTWTEGASADEQRAANRALDRLNRQLATASRFMDGYLRAVVALPLASGDANASTLEDCCLALTRCGLADDSDNATDRIDKCCEQWRQWLRDVAAGRIKLVTQTGADVPTTARRVLTGQIRSGYNWSRFGA